MLFFLNEHANYIGRGTIVTGAAEFSLSVSIKVVLIPLVDSRSRPRPRRLAGGKMGKKIDGMGNEIVDFPRFTLRIAGDWRWVRRWRRRTYSAHGNCLISFPRTHPCKIRLQNKLKVSWRLNLCKWYAKYERIESV